VQPAWQASSTMLYGSPMLAFATLQGL